MNLLSLCPKILEYETQQEIITTWFCYFSSLITAADNLIMLMASILRIVHIYGWNVVALENKGLTHLFYY
jgi:hypothetical protein